MSKKLLLSSAMFIAAISTASAADLPMYTKAPPPVAPVVFSWTGFYLGFNVGGKWAHTDDTVSVPGTTIVFGSTTDSTVIGGGQLGYNWQTGPWVLGLEGDIDAQHWRTTRVVGTAIAPFIVGDTFTADSHWEASIRGRIGYAWDRVLLYATGGAAFTQVKTSFVGFGSDDQTLVGGTVGGGLEYAFTNNVSLGVEGRWTFYGNNNFNGGTLAGLPVTQNIKLDTAEVLGKLNFRF